MKKLLLSLTLLAGLSTATLAQDKPVSFGVKAGAAFPNMTFSSSGLSASLKSNPSFYVGGTVDVSLGNIFSVQPGLTLIGKGTKFSETDGNQTAAIKISNMYLELPVNLMANFAVGPGKIFIGAGPYYSMALSGKYKVSMDGLSEEEDVDFSSDGDFKRGDFGLNFLAGYQLTSGLNVHAGYGLGLSDISQNSGGVTTKNKVFSVGLGFSL
ncbi:MAG: PorT family protein [Pedobacter sp.]|nr:MAG: PorT family protein [Pedobacter sp.]